jgi:hypothetical protein
VLSTIDQLGRVANSVELPKYTCILCVVLILHLFPLQTLQWECPAALSGSDVLKVEVYDHETIGKNR